MVHPSSWRSQEMVSTEGLVPITRVFLASYYDKYPFPPLSPDVSRLSDQSYAMVMDLFKGSPPTQGFDPTNLALSNLVSFDNPI